MLDPEINISVKRNIVIEVDREWIERIVRRVLELEDVAPHTELGLLITDSKAIQRLNRIYRDKNEPTDVLSFQMTSDRGKSTKPSFVSPPDGVRHLGEVVISYQQAIEQAREHHHSIARELVLLIVHGTLHLLGYDHELTVQARKMKTKENRILSLLEADSVESKKSR